MSKSKQSSNQFRVQFAFIALAMVTVMVLGGCALLQNGRTPIPESSDLTGHWVHAGPNGIQTDLELKRDGSLKITDIPAQVFALYGGPYFSTSGTVDWKNLVTRTGTWSVSDKRVGGQPAIDVNVKFTERPGGVETTMEVLGSRSDFSLAAVLGDPDLDNTFEFTRQ